MASALEIVDHAIEARATLVACEVAVPSESLRDAMEGRAWNASDADALVDEHPLAYKDIDVVMEDQRDLVRPLHTLTQILNYKGC
mgnify:CR=1 FL=1